MQINPSIFVFLFCDDALIGNRNCNITEGWAGLVAEVESYDDGCGRKCIP